MAYTLRFEDGFGGEASDVALPSHTPDTTGVSWTKIGTRAGDATVNGSGSTGPGTLDHPFAAGTGGYNGYTADISGAWADDQESEAVHSATTGQTLLPVNGVRLQNDGAGEIDAYAVGYDQGANIWRIIRVDSGPSAATSIATWDPGAADPPDTIVALLRSVAAADLEAFIDDATSPPTTSRMTSADATYSGGEPGIISTRSWDNKGLDQFKARDQSAAGAPDGVAAFAGGGGPAPQGPPTSAVPYGSF